MTKTLGLASSLVFTLAFGCSSSDANSSQQQNQNGDSGAPQTGGPEPVIPVAHHACPQLATGDATFGPATVKLWVGQKQTDKKGPILLYWHGTGSTADAEYTEFMNAPANPIVDEIQAEGGVAAFFTTTVGSTAANNTGNNVWYTDDFDIADDIVACAVEQLNIDTRRIYAAGCSAGGLESGTMAIMRSSYLAAAIPNSGGHILPAGIQFEDPNHIPSVMTTHGYEANDQIIVHFEDTSKNLNRQIIGAGGQAYDCTTPNGHCMILVTPIVIDPQLVVAAQWQFLKDHPFGIKTDPYANGLPAVFPTYNGREICEKVTPGGDQ
jgi:hypothetical protein